MGECEYTVGENEVTIELKPRGKEERDVKALES